MLLATPSYEVILPRRRHFAPKMTAFCAFSGRSSMVCPSWRRPRAASRLGNFACSSRARSSAPKSALRLRGWTAPGQAPMFPSRLPRSSQALRRIRTVPAGLLNAEHLRRQLFVGNGAFGAGELQAEHALLAAVGIESVQDAVTFAQRGLYRFCKPRALARTQCAGGQRRFQCRACASCPA